MATVSNCSLNSFLFPVDRSVQLSDLLRDFSLYSGGWEIQKLMIDQMQWTSVCGPKTGHSAHAPFPRLRTTEEEGRGKIARTNSRGGPSWTSGLLYSWVHRTEVAFPGPEKDQASQHAMERRRAHEPHAYLRNYWQLMASWGTRISFL